MNALGEAIAWSGAKAAAEKRGLRLARSSEVVQLRLERGMKPLTAVIHLGDGPWRPGKNMWAPVGNTPNMLGQTHTAVHGKMPGWAEDAALFKRCGERCAA